MMAGYRKIFFSIFISSMADEIKIAFPSNKYVGQQRKNRTHTKTEKIPPKTTS